MNKNLLKIVNLLLFIFLVSGCGEIPDEAREEEKNYMQMLKEKFKEVEFNIINDRTIKGSFTYEFVDNEVDVHIIDAELKNDPNYKFKICTGFSEVPTFKIVYDYQTNYYNIGYHNDLKKYFKNGKLLTLKSETYTRTHFSKECSIDYYNDIIIFDKNSSVEQIAQEIASYDIDKFNIDFEYGDVKACLKISNEKTYQDYVSTINEVIEDYNNNDVSFYCY